MCFEKSANKFMKIAQNGFRSGTFLIRICFICQNQVNDSPVSFGNTSFRCYQKRMHNLSNLLRSTLGELILLLKSSIKMKFL